MGDQEFIDHWKLSEKEYQYVLDGQSTLDDMEDYGQQLPEEVIEEVPTAEETEEEETEEETPEAAQIIGEEESSSF